MSLCALERRLQIEGQVLRGEPLAAHTSFHIGGPADYFVKPRGVADIEAALAFAQSQGLPWRVLGNGTNTLFLDEGFAGVVIYLGPTTGLSGVKIQNGRLYAEAGASLAKVRQLCEANGCGALDFLVGIPASVGGAVAMNAGIPEAAIGDKVASLTVLTPNGKVRRLSRVECGFAYRSSRVRSQGLVVLAAEFKLEGDRWDKAALMERRKNQPMGYSPGCVFKNPPQVPKSAGWLIDKSGLKGYKVGNAQVSRCHGNFILNRGKANCVDVLTLIDIVREKVYKEFNLELKLELEVALN